MYVIRVIYACKYLDRDHACRRTKYRRHVGMYTDVFLCIVRVFLYLDSLACHRGRRPVIYVAYVGMYLSDRACQRTIRRQGSYRIIVFIMYLPRYTMRVS